MPCRWEVTELAFLPALAFISDKKSLRIFFFDPALKAGFFLVLDQSTIFTPKDAISKALYFIVIEGFLRIYT
jgi:hypothetical protein